MCVAVPKLRFKKFSEDWEKTTVQESCSMFSGGTPSITISEYYGGSLPFIKSGEIENSVTAMTISEKGLSASSAKIVSEGDLLLALYGANSGSPAISRISGAINQAILCIRSKQIDIYFLYSWLVRAKTQIISTYLQGGQGNLSAEIIKKLSIIFPNKSEQDKISKFFKLLDSKIALQRRKVELLKEYKKGFIQQQITNSEWPQEKVENLFTHISVKGRKDLEVLTIIQGLGTMPRSQSGRTISFAADSVDGYKAVNQDDFIIHLRSFEGGLEIANEIGVVSPAYTILRGGERIAPEYFKHYFRSQYFIDHVLAKSVEGIRDGRQISFNQFKDSMIPIPPVDIQQHIALVLEAIESKVNAEHLRQIRLEKFKQGLLQQMFV
jgi:type I restriction enzyme S subunit